MDKKLLLENHYHFIGIGGIGMSAIAKGLLKKGYSISGSDLVKNEETDVSSAIKPDNEEYSYCKKNNLQIKHRSEILAMLMQFYTSLAVGGTHGKTSTSTFLSTLLELCTNNSSSITGGIIPIYNSNAHIENTKFLVAEVDESDGTINKYNSDIGIINNIDFDHCDHFNNIDEVLSSFKDFASNTKNLLLNYDCEITKKNFHSDYKWSNKDSDKVNFSIIPVSLDKTHTIGEYYENGCFIDMLNIPIPGLHNLSNITASIAASRMAGVNFNDIRKVF